MYLLSDKLEAFLRDDDKPNIVRAVANPDIELAKPIATLQVRGFPYAF